MWVLVIAALFALLVFVSRVGPELLANTSGLGKTERAQEVGRVRTAILAFLAAAIASVGAIYTVRTFRLNQRGQITDRFIRAVAQLGDDSRDVRIGGLFALERIAQESAMEHGPVMEVLATFVRERSPAQFADTLAVSPRAPADATAAVTVLERRNRSFDSPGLELDLSSTNLARIRLRRGADLRGMRLAGASLAHAELHSANLTDVDLRGADLSYARLDRAELRDAHLFGATLQRSQLAGADLRGAILSGARLPNAYLIHARLEGADFRSYFGPDRYGDIVNFVPAEPGEDGAKDAAAFSGATYDATTKWPDLPPDYAFDPVARCA